MFIRVDQKSSQKIAQKSNKTINLPQQKSKLRETSFSDVFNNKKLKQQIQVLEQNKQIQKSKTPLLFKRSTKIYNLQEEFELLKKKIKEVEIKKEKIIQKIQVDKSPNDKRSIQNINYGNKTPCYYNMNIKCINEDQLNKYQQYQVNQKYDIRHQTEQLTSNPLINWQNQRYPSDSNEKWIKQNIPQKSVDTSKYIYDLENGVEYVRRENEKQMLQIKMLEQKLKKQQNKLLTYKSNYRDLYENVKYIVSSGLQKLMQNTIIVQLFEMDRKNKQNKQKLEQILERTQNVHNQRKMMKKFFVRSTQNLLPKNNQINKRQQEIKFEKQKELQNKRFRELELLVQKYEKIIKAKNQQIEIYVAKTKSKDKQINQIKNQLHRVKDEKKKLQIDFQFETEQLSIKVNTITENNIRLFAQVQRLHLLLEKKNNMSTSQQQYKQKVNQNESLRIIIEDLRHELQRSKHNLTQTKQNLQNNSKILNEKNKLILSLEKQLLSNKEKKSQLLNQYQQNLQKNRKNYKAKLQQLNNTLQQANTKINQKDQIIKDLQYKEKNFKEKEIEYQVQISTMQQKLNIKEQFEKQSLCSFTAYRKNSTTSTQNDLQYKTFIQSLNKQIKQLQLQNTQLKLNQDRIKFEREKERIDYKNLSDQFNQQNNKFKSIIKTKQENLTEIQDKIEQFKQRQVQLNEQKQTYQTKYQLLQKELKLTRDEKNILQQKIANYQNIIVKDLKKQLTDKKEEIISLENKVQNKFKELKSYVSQIGQLQKQFQRYESKFKFKQSQFAKYQSIDAQQKMLINKFERQLKQAQQENKIFESLKYQNHKYQLKLKDLQQQIKARTNNQNKINQELKREISKRKQQNQKLKVELINFQQINKYQKKKIEELQLDICNLNSNKQATIQKSQSNFSYIKLDKIKSLEKCILDAQILKVNLERKITNLESELNKHKQDYNTLFTQFQHKKSEFNRQILFYDDKNQVQELKIMNLEKIIKQKCDNEKNYQSNLKEENIAIKNEIKSQASLMFSINSMEDKNLELNLQQEYEDINDASVSQIFKVQNISINQQLKNKKRYYHIFQKTRQYVSNLKKNIAEKNKRIKILQRSVDALKQNRNIQANKLELDFEEQDFSSYDLGTIHDNYSMILESPSKKSLNNRKFKIIEQQSMLIKEQNNLLIQQLQKLQDDLENAQQQEDNLVRMKQIYKQQINTLKKQLQQKQQIIQLSESVHNLQAIRQLFTKIRNILSVADERRQQKKKELEQYMKIIMNLLNINKQKNINKK